MTNYMVKSAPATAGFALQIPQNPAPIRFPKNKFGTALLLLLLPCVLQALSIPCCQSAWISVRMYMSTS